jgi:hypothetical protein
LKVLNCEACAKYVFNAARLESDCCYGCWSCGIETDLVELHPDQTEEQITCEGCCTFKHKT